ncbi:repeat-containing protein [Candidatus Magnetobacterium bavaricum]|uniref:Repeat-containing protein n=1 Tax=Candidatus Magnetobacterium bavaricum TaxID=29290 RepID=A0A0F3GXE7_9BACT|nr:repeat-containing protein [Candidatus Magnetobacterium bavaricum]
MAGVPHPLRPPSEPPARGPAPLTPLYLVHSVIFLYVYLNYYSNRKRRRVEGVKGVLRVGGIVVASMVVCIALLGCDTPKKTEIFLQTGHAGYVRSVSYSPDGKFIASGSFDNTVKIWDTSMGVLLRTLSGHDNWVKSVSYSPDGRFIASGSFDNTVKIWDASTGTLIRTLSGHDNGVESVSYSIDGRFIASGSGDKTVKIWDASTGALIRTLSGHTKTVRSISYSPDGRFIASGSGDNTVKVWDISTGTLIRTFAGYTYLVSSLSYSPDGRFIASGSGDNTVKIWDASTGALIRTLSGHDNGVDSVSYSPDGRFIASGSSDKAVKIWDTSMGTLIHTLSGHDNWVSSVSYSPDGRFIASGNGDKTIKIWDASTGNLIRTHLGYIKWVSPLSYSPDGRFIASGSEDNTVKIWDTYTDNLTHTLRPVDVVSSLSYSPDGRFIASGSWDNTLKIWNVSTGDLIRTIYGHIIDVIAVSYSPDGRFIASGSSDNTLKIWNASTGDLINTFLVPGIVSLSYSPDGRFIAWGSRDKILKVLDISTGNLIRTLSGHTGDVRSLSYRPDGKFIASGSEYNTVKIWDVSTGVLIRTLSGGTVKYSPDGRFLAAGSWDGTIRITDANTGSLTMTIASLPANEWLTFKDDNLFYASSLQGDEYAAVRFDNALWPVYPLKYYRKELQRPDAVKLFGQPQPKIKPKRIKLWWDTRPNKGLWIALSSTMTLLVLVAGWYLRYRVYSKEKIGSLSKERDKYSQEAKTKDERLAEKTLESDRLKNAGKTEITAPYQPIDNPYRPGPPLTTGHVSFVGREEQFNEVIAGTTKIAGHCFIVTGERRVGKTSFVYALKEKLDDGIKHAFVDIQGLMGRSTAGLFYELSDSLCNAAGIELKSTFSDFKENPFDAFAGVLKELEKGLGETRILLILDEFELLQDQVDKQIWPEEVLQVIRGMIQHRKRIIVMFCGTYRLHKLRSDQWGILFGIAHTIKMDALPKTEAELLIRLCNIDISAAAVERILAFTGSHPYYLQIVSSTMINHLNNVKRLNVIDADLTVIFRKCMEGDLENTLDYIWSGVLGENATGRLLLSLIAGLHPEPEQWIGMDDIKEGCKKFCDAKTLHATLEELAGRQLIARQAKAEKKDFDYRCKTGLLHQWLRERRPFQNTFEIEYNKGKT